DGATRIRQRISSCGRQLSPGGRSVRGCEGALLCARGYGWGGCYEERGGGLGKAAGKDDAAGASMQRGPCAAACLCRAYIRMVLQSRRKNPTARGLCGILRQRGLGKATGKDDAAGASMQREPCAAACLCRAYISMVLQCRHKNPTARGLCGILAPAGVLVPA